MPDQATAPTLYASTIASPVGPLRLAVDEQGRLVRLDFLDEDGSFSNPVNDSAWPPQFTESPQACAEAARQLGDYFDGKLRSFDLEYRFLEGTEFRQRVWRALEEIPYGETISYRELAERIGKPAASRAVGGAVGANPVAIVLPCHRVIGADHSLTGFGGGLQRKRSLLRLEGALPPALL